MIQFTEEQNKLLERRGCGVQMWDRAIEGNQYQCCAQIVKLKPDRTSGEIIPGTAVVGTDERDAANKAIAALANYRVPDLSIDSREELAAKDKEIELLKKQLATQQAGGFKPVVEADEIVRSEEATEAISDIEPNAFPARRRRGRPPKLTPIQDGTSA